MKFRQLNEALDAVTLAPTLEERVGLMHNLARTDSAFVPLLRMAFIPTEKIVGIPEGVPDTYKPEKDMPDGISDTTVRQELRRIRNFITGGSVEKLNRVKRESLWISMLEGFHWKEAEVLTHIKDQTLLTDQELLAQSQLLIEGIATQSALVSTLNSQLDDELLATLEATSALGAFTTALLTAGDAVGSGNGAAAGDVTVHVTVQAEADIADIARQVAEETDRQLREISLRGSITGTGSFV